jgi:DNA mismatch repair protein MutL
VTESEEVDMPQIQVLDQSTINKIAAGEVIERPASVVKELLENAIDAKATAITVEIRDGGIAMIRVTDNGGGIPKDQVQIAFKRHATSKIRTVEDLFMVSSLGFRGEALSSIAAVSQVEIITRTPGSLTGTRYQIEGGVEKGIEEIGAPEGTTFIARNLFYNTPVRRKFLKTAMTEGAHVADLVEKIALSHPEISIRFIQNNQNKLFTSGNHNLKDIVYTVYGREITSNIVPVKREYDAVTVGGFIGKPVIARSNRSFENYFINGRYIKSGIISKAIEEAYKPFMMQHKYPFTMLQLTIEPEFLDVNVHPTKMELRFQDGEHMFRMVRDAISEVLMHKELIPEVELDEKQRREEERQLKKLTQEKRIPVPEPFEHNRRQQMKLEQPEIKPEQPEIPVKTVKPLVPKTERNILREADYPYGEASRNRSFDSSVRKQEPMLQKPVVSGSTETKDSSDKAMTGKTWEKPKEEIKVSHEIPAENKHEKTSVQMDLFEEKLLEPKARSRHKLIGQLFDTYWMVEFNDQLYIIDQHAAHEKVLYEKTMATLKTRQYTSQMVNPPIILSLSSQEENLLKNHLQYFMDLGFQIEPFGGREYAVRGVPDNLFSIAKKELLMEMLDSLAEDTLAGNPDMIYEKVASMSCKAAVKGNHSMSAAEADHLIDSLLDLENPYACPHGRPTIISMSKYEIEKKFKRIV